MSGQVFISIHRLAKTGQAYQLKEKNFLATPKAENTDLLHKGKYHCMADLLFACLGFCCFAYVELDRALQVWLNPNQAVQ